MFDSIRSYTFVYDRTVMADWQIVYDSYAIVYDIKFFQYDNKVYDSIR